MFLAAVYAFPILFVMAALGVLLLAAGAVWVG